MRRKEKKKIFDINNINKKTLNIIGVTLSIIIIIIITAYYSLNMNREYINGDKKLPFLIEKNTIITVLDGKRKTLENDKENEMLEIGIIDDIYIDLKLNDEKNNKIKSCRIKELLPLYGVVTDLNFVSLIFCEIVFFRVSSLSMNFPLFSILLINKKYPKIYARKSALNITLRANPPSVNKLEYTSDNSLPIESFKLVLALSL